MTELQWLIKMLTQHKLSAALKDLFIERIGEVESTLIPRSSNGRTVPFEGANGGSIPSRGSIQAPSMQRILDEQPIQVIPAPPPVQRIVGGEIDTGRGTKGPRKF